MKYKSLYKLLAAYDSKRKCALKQILISEYLIQVGLSGQVCAKPDENSLQRELRTIQRTVQLTFNYKLTFHLMFNLWPINIFLQFSKS